MNGYHSSDGYRIEPLDDRDEASPPYRIDPQLSSPDFQFSEEDPATADPDPKPELAPPWNHEDRNIEA